MNDTKSVRNLALHFVKISKERREPPFLYERVLRRFDLTALNEAGVSVSSAMTNEELRALWSKHIADKGKIPFDPRPNVYALVPCYERLMLGLKNYNALRFQATDTFFDTLSIDGKILHRLQPLRTGDPFLAVKEIAESDDIIRPWLEKVETEQGRITIQFALTKQQFKEFRRVCNDELSDLMTFSQLPEFIAIRVLRYMKQLLRLS